MSKIVVIGGSAGSVTALKTIFRELPKDFPAPVLVVTHIGEQISILPSLLGRVSALPVRHATQGEPIAAGQVLMAPSDLHLTVARSGSGAFARLSRGPKENHSRPAIDPLFRSAATAYGANAIAVLLSGYLDDGTVGLQAIKTYGGTALVQDPADAEAPDMPASAMEHVAVDFVRRAEDIAALLVELAGVDTPAPAPQAAADQSQSELRSRIAIENRMLDEDFGMGELDQIGKRAALTCPECGGAIWEIQHSRPLRYRCHTGHAFTAKVLARLQSGEVEEAMWAAVRALHEQERLFRRLHQQAQASGEGLPGRDDGAQEYLIKAEQTRDHGQQLRDLIATRLHIVPG